MVAGLLFAALSAFFNGTFGMLAKQARGVHPLVTNYWLAEGAALSGLLLLAVSPRVFTLWGLLSGALFVLSAAHAVAAIQCIGLAAASGVWCGTAVVVSFGYGVAVAGDEIEHLPQAVAAVCLTLAGIAGVALAAWMGGSHDAVAAEGAVGGADSVGSSLLGADYTALTVEAPPSDAAAAAAGVPAAAEGAVAAPPEHDWQRQQQLAPGSRALLGLLAAVVAGGLGGLILAPMLSAPAEAQGLPYVPSMSAGALLLAPAITSMLVATKRVSFQHATSSKAAGPGMAAGVCWNAGNVCCILAVTDPRVGMSVAMPIMQAGLLVAGCWGILLHREIRGWPALALWAASGAALVAGAALLADAKGGDW